MQESIDFMNQYLNCQQKHKLHLLLQASFRNRNPIKAVEENRIDPALFTDIFLRNDLNRQVSYEELEAISRLCYRLIRWKTEQLPEIDPEQTYANQTELLLNELSQDCQNP